MKTIGYLWNNKEIEIIEHNGEFFALNDWNGEKWLNAWKVKDKNGYDILENGKKYEVTPIYKEIAEEEFEIIGVEIE